MDRPQEQGAGASEPASTAVNRTAGLLLNAPVLLLFPIALAYVNVMESLIGVPILLAAFGASLLIYAMDWAMSDKRRESYDFAGRFVIVLINTGLLWAFTSGFINF